MSGLFTHISTSEYVEDIDITGFGTPLGSPVETITTEDATVEEVAIVNLDTVARTTENAGGVNLDNIPDVPDGLPADLIRSVGKQIFLNF